MKPSLKVALPFASIVPLGCGAALAALALRPGLAPAGWLAPLVALPLGGLALTAAAYLALGRRLFLQFEASSAHLAALAHGKLGARLAPPSGSSPELLALARSANGIGISQSAVLAEIRATAEILERNSRLFLGSCATVGEQSEAMRAATNTIAAALEQISASIATIAAQSQQIDGTARGIAGTTRALHRSASETSASFGNQAASLESTAGSLASARERIGQLRESAHAITEFASQILDLVSKTRLLALNATIEAARAGEAGKSFAVVAGEVKDLSAQTSAMAEGIQSRITEIEERTGAVAGGLEAAFAGMEALRADAEATLRSAQSQLGLTQEADRALQEIIQGTADVSRALHEAQAGIGEIEKNAIETDSRAVRLHRGIAEIRVHAEDLGRAGHTLEGSIGHLEGPEPFFPWTPRLALGIDVMDEQHKVLVRLLNHLHDLVTHHGPEETVGVVLAQLADYTRFHFEAEERFMEGLGYGEIEAHKEIHRAFLGEIAALVDTRRRGGAVDGKALLDRLRSWLTGHIMGNDRKYAELARRAD